MGKAKGGLHKNVLGNPNLPKWREGVTWVREDAKDKELEELQGMFKKCGGDKNFTAIPRKKFMTKCGYDRPFELALSWGVRPHMCAATIESHT